MDCKPPFSNLQKGKISLNTVTRPSLPGFLPILRLPHTFALLRNNKPGIRPPKKAFPPPPPCIPNQKNCPIPKPPDKLIIAKKFGFLLHRPFLGLNRYLHIYAGIICITVYSAKNSLSGSPFGV